MNTKQKKDRLDAEHYQKNSQIQSSNAHVFIDELHIATTDNILDLGCGDGGVTAYLSQLASEGQVTGVDPSENMIQSASDRYCKDINHLNFKQGSAEDFHGEALYTLITSFNSFYWVRSQQLALDNIYQALKPKGRFAALIYPAESLYWSVFSEILNTPTWNRYYEGSVFKTLLSVEALCQLAQIVGFSVKLCEKIDGLAIYHNLDEFMNFVNGWLPLMVDLPSDKELEFLKLAYELAQLRFGMSDKVELPYTKLHLILEKS